MPIHRLNHAVLYVRDLVRSTAFYRDVLGFRVSMSIPGQAAFVQAPGSTNDHDLGLFAIGRQAQDSSAGRTRVGLYHLAWEVERLGDLEGLADSLSLAGALVGASDHGTTKSLYAKDPDGLEFEVMWMIPLAEQTEADRTASSSIRPLDLPSEVARFGADATSALA